MTPRWPTRLRQLFSPQGFRGPVLTLLSGSTVVLALAYFAQPLLTRLYTPAEFGLADYFVAVVAVLGSFTSLRFEDALMLPEDDREAVHVVRLAFLVLVGFTVLAGVSLFWREAMATAAGLPALAPWLLLVPPALLIFRTGRIAEVWLIRKRRFRTVTHSQIAGALTMVSTRLGAGLPAVSAGAGGLIGGYLAGIVATMAVLGWRVVRAFPLVLKQAFSGRAMLRLARRYRRFPLFSTPSTLLSTLVARLPILLLPVFFDATVVGLFGRAFAVLAIPLSHLGGAIAQVFFVHAAEAQREARLPAAVDLVHQRLVMLGLFPTLVLLLAGPDLLEVFFGASWRTAGQYLQFIAPWLFLGGVASPLTRLFDVLERQRLDLLMSGLTFAALATAMVIGGRTGDVSTTLLLLGLAGVAARLVQLAVLLRLGGVAAAAALRAYRRYLLFSLPGLALVGAALWLDRPLATTAAAVLAGLLYASLVLWKDRLLAYRPEKPEE